MSRFFIDRPIFANVIGIVTILIGAVTLQILPIEQYPQITPPTVQVTTSYPGANARVLSDTVAAPIEQEVNGVEGMLYMSSNCAADGSYVLTVTFDVGTDLDLAQVRVQNRMQIALPRLPEEVQRQGITAKKQSTAIILVVGLTSSKVEHDSLYLSNYANLRVKDVLSRIPGVGDIQIFGAANYGMRVWLDPERMKSRSITTTDVLAAIREQNVQVAAGTVGQQPAPAGQNFQYTVTTLGRLAEPEQFGNIIVKSDPDPQQGARLTRVKDVARVELGGQVYDQWCEIGGKPAAGIAVYQLPGANALDVAKHVYAGMDTLRKDFPEGVELGYPYNTTVFVEESIREVYKTLAEAGVLVLIVIMLFLQDWRAVLIPATTVPVTIIGAFAAMFALGFSVNLLTLFGLILAVGIVVDDAIVIVENAVHHIDVDKLDPKHATIKAMDEVIGPVIGITLVLMAVFIPTAFLPGITGQLYRQFALTIAATALISALNAVTLKPAQCAVWLKPTPERKNAFFRAFNRGYDRVERAYLALLRPMVKAKWAMMLAYCALVGVAGWGFTRLPTGFLPTEDQGYAVMGILLPDASSQQRTRAVIDKVSKILKETEGVETWVMIGGTSILDGATASNSAAIYVRWAPYEKRTKPGLDQDSIINNLRGRFSEIQEAALFLFPPPAIQGLGVSGGFQMQLEDRGGVGLTELQTLTDEMIRDGNGQSGLKALTTPFRSNVPQLYVDVDRVKAKSLDIPLSNVFEALSAFMGSAYVNDFNKFDRTYQVRVQADQKFRVVPDDIRRLDVRTASGQMVPLGTLATVSDSLGPQVITRYNLYPSASISGQSAPGFSSGQALNLMEQMAADKLPSGAGIEWTAMSYQEKKVGNQAIGVFGLAILLVYLVLAAQYESWSIPAAVILVVPLALLGTVIAVAVRGMDNNIYTQIGIVLIIALASKNAILIVEFARELRAKGKSVVEAALESARLRFRPILMTSFAFILGIAPLVVAEGAGAASRRALGTAVFGGMCAATVLAVFFVPVFYVVIQGLSERVGRKKEGSSVVAIEANGLGNGHPALQDKAEIASH